VAATPAPTPAKAAAPPPAPPLDEVPVREPLALAVTPEDAIVTVDGARVDDPARLVLPAGGGTVIVRRAGFTPRTVVVDAQHPLPPRIELVATKPAGEGYLKVFAGDVDWAEVAVDGRKAGHTPTRPLPLPEGTHRVVVTCTDACSTKHVLLQRTVTIRDGETTVLRAE